jgi:murein L,D-transpeptidase YafK
MKTSRRHSFVSQTLVLLLLAAGCLPAWPKSPNAGGAEQADRVVIIKSQRTLTLYRQGQVLKTYKVALGSHPVGPKAQQGDHRTPEGVYTIDSRNPRSQFHLSLHVSYPNAEDRARAKKLRVSPGGDIFIHGLPPAYSYLGPLHRKWDWTLGCVAVTDQEIEEIWSMVPIGTTVEIKP